MKRLEIVLFPGPVSDAPVETLAVGVPQDERPLAGNAGWVDWRLGGAISRQLQSGFASGKPGEAVLLPAQPPIRGSRILLFGLGPADASGRAVQRAFSAAAAKLVGLRTPLALLALPRAIDFELDGEFVLRGCVQALSAVHGGAGRGDPELALVLPDATRHDLALEGALADVAEDAERRQVRLEVTWVDGTSTAAGPAPVEVTGSQGEASDGVRP